MCVRRLSLIVVVFILLAPLRASAQIAVIDAANLEQNILQVLKTITMIANQVEQIRIAIEQLEDMLKNSRGIAGTWDTDTLRFLRELEELLQQEQALAYSLQHIDQLFRQRFPGFQPPRDWQREYTDWTETVLDTLRGTLDVLHTYGEDFGPVEERTRIMQQKSEASIGRLQAIKVGNMLAAENLQQLVKLRQLTMVQINAQNTWMAKVTNQEAQIDAFTREWLLNAKKPVPAELRTQVQRALEARQ